MATNDPIWRLMREEGLQLRWLANQTGYKHSYVQLISCGGYQSTPEFRRRCSVALGKPESELFLSKTIAVA